MVLADDLSMNLLPYMPNVAALAAAGTTFSNYTVTDSLCCPSRASIFAGRFPHNTEIFKNHGKFGGFEGFYRRGSERSTFATSLQQAGYRTAMMGKYLNGYVPKETLGGTKGYVPPGWSEWVVGGNAAYDQYGYSLNENGTVRNYGHAPGDFLNTVLTARASSFIKASAAARTPFMIEVASYAPHAPFTAAPRDVKSFKGLKAPRGPAFGSVPTNAPPWLASPTSSVRPSIQRMVSIPAASVALALSKLSVRVSGPPG
jgi:arylsulfatase A-like enzyme